jgi:hypothetical protein
MTRSQSFHAAALAAALAAAPAAFAAVTADEAARLKRELTPLGAERAGNADGSIPAWDGGIARSGDKASGRMPDPFKDDKPLFSINAKNMAQHGERLSEGTRAMMQRYPDSFRIDVYPTRRSAAAPQWVYDNTFKNATRAKLSGDVVEGAYGGIPFPLPRNGAEVMWNHLLRWRGASFQYFPSSYQLTADGNAVLSTNLSVDEQFPYYFQDGSPEQLGKTGDYFQTKVAFIGPAIRAGEAVAGRINLEPGKDQAWVYLTGQRRVRKLPNPCCDTPAASTAGVSSYDELTVFLGRLDRFDWKLVGKQEMFIPYNGNRLMQAKTDAEVLSPHHVNPQWMRWELHRVWVVEATVRNGQRHVSPKGRYYCDEDTWTCVLGDRWDAKGQLWKTLWASPIVVPGLPATTVISFGLNDLLSGSAFAGGIYSAKSTQYVTKPRYPDTYFSADALAGEGVR